MPATPRRCQISPSVGARQLAVRELENHQRGRFGRPPAAGARGHRHVALEASDWWTYVIAKWRPAERSYDGTDLKPRPRLVPHARQVREDAGDLAPNRAIDGNPLGRPEFDCRFHVPRAATRHSQS